MFSDRFDLPRSFVHEVLKKLRANSTIAIDLLSGGALGDCQLEIQLCHEDFKTSCIIMGQGIIHAGVNSKTREMATYAN